MILTVGDTDVSVDVQIVDDSGLPVTGLAAATFPAVKISKGTGADIAVTPLSNLASLVAAHADGGVLERGEGVYRLDLPDTLASTAAPTVKIRGEASGKRLIAPTIQVGFGDLAEAVWANSERTLTQTAAAVAATLAGTTITITRGDTISISITGLGSIANRSKLWFTVKRQKSDVDAGSIIQIEETAGLIYLNGAGATAGQGSIAVDDEDAGDITIALDELASAELAAKELNYDIQVLRTTGAVNTLSAGTFIVVADVTRALS